MRPRILSLAAAVLGLLTPQAPAAVPALPGEVLVLPAAARGGRTPVPTDPITAAMVAGTWQPPKVGDKVQFPGGPAREWVAAPVKDGTVSHPGVPGGYVYLPLKADRERVVVLHAVGHVMVYVNGVPRAGDVYGNGIVRLPVPLREGENHLLFAGGRGPLKVTLLEPAGDLELDTADLTAPDFPGGVKIDTVAALLVRNNSGESAKVVVETTVPGGEPIRTPIPPRVPHSTGKVGFRLVGPAPAKEGAVPVRVRLLAADGGKELASTELQLRAVPPEATHRRTFVSTIDGSVQYFSVVPAKAGEPGKKPGLVLTLHGASVEAAGQAACYAPKPGLFVVAPTNRRPFGFDWEDWGRLDAMEVLDLAGKEFGTDPRRTYLTGHSMGGHGTWHLGVTFPGQFAAIAPSAGWVSMWSYAGMRKQADPSPALEPILRASNPSDTLALVRNLTPTGIYVLHGDADDNVPVGQARTMRKELADFHPDFVYREQPGAGHWWGNACVDWPPIFEFFARRELPERAAVRRVDFRTANPAVSADCHWLRIDAQVRPLMISRAEVACDPEKRLFRGTTENVARLSLDVAHLPPGKTLRVELDDTTLGEVPWPAGGRVWLAKAAGKWAAVAEPAPGLKGPHRAGPFKEAFRNRFVLVYGTKGTPVENTWALAKARYDAEVFWYRGNGGVELRSDTGFDAKAEPDRNVILYGHAGMNAAWAGLLGGCPVRVEAGSVRVGDREEKGDSLGCLFAFSRAGSDRALVGVVAGTGPKGLRATDRLPYFSSGVGYPDWTVIDPAGVVGSGYFDNDWKPTPAESGWRK